MICAVDSTGSYIKVFDVVSSACLYSFKRGMKACTISNVSFDPISTYLAVSSSAGTVHLFSLKPGTMSGSSAISQPSKLVETGFKLFQDLKSYLPHAITLPTSTARLHLKEQIGCNWTAKEGSFVGPMVVFSKDKNKLVFFSAFADKLIVRNRTMRLYV